MIHQFKIGDRIKVSELNELNMHRNGTEGVIVDLPKKKEDSFTIKFDDMGQYGINPSRVDKVELVSEDIQRKIE